ncbi:MAG: fibronectin type III domain-containing protein [Flavobacteriales bacterium]|nr:fibronectin type III domain-containing protein [Flavobacteriales bacterium]MBK9538903.1 fibronectin type III domain-containing protein [Flavobacteriales bacterium]
MKKVWYIIKLGLGRVTATALVEKGRNHVTMMTGNPAFLAPNPTPEPSLVALTDACNALDAANQAYAFNKGKLEKEARDLAYENLKVIIRDLGGYVQFASKGEKDIMLSAGFDVTKSPSAPVVPTTPRDVRAESTRVRKQILVRWGASKGHRLYRVEQTEGDPTLETGWEVIAETGKNRLVVNDLESFKTYSFRVVAIGTIGNSIPSDAASAIAA